MEAAADEDVVKRFSQFNLDVNGCLRPSGYALLAQDNIVVRSAQ
jgi:hypothetical protein